MSYPTVLLEQLHQLQPSFIAEFWVYGLFNINDANPTSGVKGIIAADEENLAFFGRDGTGKEILLTIPRTSIQQIILGPEGTTGFSLKTDKGNVDISYMSRGNVTEFIPYLTN